MLERDGVASAADLQSALPSEARLNRGPVAIIECFQQIPCNPCADACPQGAIAISGNISERPAFDETKCSGCGICVTKCPGLAIVVADFSYAANTALLKIPYEFTPLPAAGETVEALGRAGLAVGDAQVLRVQQQANKTTVLWLTVAKEQALDVRNIRRKAGAKA
jgi:Fe-S-cluster-containing hydrogenase component 2